MTGLEAQARAFAARYPTPAASPSPSTDETYDQNCGIAMYQFGSWLGWRTPPVGDISSAYRVAMASGPLDRDPTTARPGDWHFWDIAGPSNGHVAMQMDDNSLVFMGSAGVWEDIGVDIGFSSVAAYAAYRPWAVYLGHADNYAGGTIDAARFRSSTTAGDDRTTIEGEDIMATLDQLREVIAAELAPIRAELATAVDRLRRESRLRLYVNTDTGQMVALDPETGAAGVVIGPWDSKADPGKADSLRVNYALTADTPAQAQRLDSRQWRNLMHDMGITAA
jgi:hypothetical protein